MCCEGAALAGLALAVGIATSPESSLESSEEGNQGGHFVNWSNTHEVHTRRLSEPETQEELEKIVEDAHLKGERVLFIPCLTTYSKEQAQKLPN